MAWTDLPYDILKKIEELLLVRDRIYFHGVCRSWRSAPSILPSTAVSLSLNQNTESGMSQCPILMHIGRARCNFLNPINNTTYTMNLPESIAGARIRFSKGGWLLMSQDRFAVFFFNPFTNERIDLPDLDRNYSFNGIAFSSLPTSPDCLVFAIYGNNLSRELNYSFIRRRDDTWETCLEEFDGIFVPSLTNPVFYKGAFYCPGIDGNLGIFDPREEDQGRRWSVLPTPKNPCAASYFKNYLVECNGELVSVFEGRAGAWVNIFQLDPCLMAWKKVESLGDKTLFVDRTTSLSATTPAMQECGMGNHIYYARVREFNNNKHIRFYSLGTRKFHTFGHGDTCSHDHGFYNTTDLMHSIWIEPTFALHTDEELHWYSEDETETD